MLFWMIAALLTIGALVFMFGPSLVAQRISSGVAGKRSCILLGLALAVPVVAMGTYLVDGRPGLPDRPFAKREAERMAAGLLSDQERALVRDLAAQMERHPENAAGWAMLGAAYFRDRRFEEAVAAYRNAIALRPSEPDLLCALGEALALHAGGEITPEAERAFKEALDLRSGEPKARYFLALAKAQRGDADAARIDLAALLREAPPGAPWRDAIEMTLARIEQAIQDKAKPAP